MSLEPKEILFENEARLKLMEGIDQLADVVKWTFGPAGRNIGVEERFGAPKIESSGNNIVRDFKVKDPMINMGVCLAKQAISKIREKTGDGTTTALILLQAMIKEGYKYLTSGESAIEIHEQMERASKIVLQEIEKLAYSTKSLADIKNIATISASSNEFIGQMIAEAYKNVGNDGLISIEEASGYQTYISKSQGMEIDGGYTNSYFITNKEKMLVELIKPKVLIYDAKITSIQQILPLIQSFVGSEHQLLILAEDIAADVTSTLALNHSRNLIKVCVMNTSSIGEEKKRVFDDIALCTNCLLISPSAGINLSDITIDDLGTCEKVTLSKEKTTFIGGMPDQARIDKKLKLLDENIKNTTNDPEKKMLSKQKARLLGKIAVIHVGAYSEQELYQKKQLFEDSLASTKAALSDGITIGGAMGFYIASKKLKDQDIGSQILIKALTAPISQLIQNAGYSPFLILEEIDSNGKNFGFNAKTEKVENLLDAGIIDPIKVLKSSFIHSLSVAKTILLTESLICKTEEN